MRLIDADALESQIGVHFGNCRRRKQVILI